MLLKGGDKKLKGQFSVHNRDQFRNLEYRQVALGVDQVTPSGEIGAPPADAGRHSAVRAGRGRLPSSRHSGPERRWYRIWETPKTVNGIEAIVRHYDHYEPASISSLNHIHIPSSPNIQFTSQWARKLERRSGYLDNVVGKV